MTKKNILIILFTTLILGWQLLRPGFYSMHDDLQVMRLYEMDRCFGDGQIPCRWVADLGQNYGQPLFNFYSALPYYLGEAIHLTGISFIDTTKILFLLSLFLSGVFTYLLAKEFFKSEQAALVSAIAYMVAPYHAVDIFVRGALSESWGLTLIPLVLFAVIKVCRQPKATHSALLSFSLAALLITHNITVLISAPLLAIFGFYFFLTSHNRLRQFAFLVPGVLLGVGLSAFFLFPVIFEQQFIQTKFLTTDYFDFRAHFATINQLFAKLSWGYGPSRFNSYQYPETLSFFVGIVPILAIILAPIALYLKRKDRVTLSLITTTFSLGLLYLFMTHSRSVMIWEFFPTLKFVQFPWRFLGPVSLLTSLLIGFCLESITIKPESKIKIFSFVAALLIAADFNYFRFEKYFPNITDAKKLSGAEYDNQIRGALLDYLPQTVQVIPEAKAPAAPVILNGDVSINYFDKRSNYFSSEFDSYTDSATIQFPVMDFPGWTLYQNRLPTPIKFDIDNDFGLITLNLAKGHHLIQGFFENTPLRLASNLITFGSGLTLASWLILTSKKNEN